MQTQQMNGSIIAQDQLVGPAARHDRLDQQKHNNQKVGPRYGQYLTRRGFDRGYDPGLTPPVLLRVDHAPQKQVNAAFAQ